MSFCTPEEAGIPSACVSRFYDALDKYHISAHSVILARGDAVFSECYYAPFHKDYLHRMYSTSKTFVAVAIGFCLEDGLLSLDDYVSKFFPDYLARDGAVTHSSTVRELLTMETTMPGYNWFGQNTADRTATYFENPQTKLPGTLFDYDSCGSFMLTVIVERLTGKPFLQYLREKVLDEIGFSREAYCLTVPEGYSWGDSGIMCTARDLLIFARFLLNGGRFNGKRYLSEDYMREATAMRVSNNDFGVVACNAFGYGYQIWGMPRGCFSTMGMGSQLGFCDPQHDLIFVINADTQGNTYGEEQILESLYRHILDNISEDGSPLPPNPGESTALEVSLKGKKLFCLGGNEYSPFADKISGVTFRAEDNPMGIKWFRVELGDKEGKLCYENAQGAKCIPFGFGHNVFAQFPQEGYSDIVGNVSVPGHTYRAAFSADWPEEQKLRIRVQIIDKYFGNLAIVFGFRNEKQVSVRMVKAAEHFLDEYSGTMTARAE